MVWLDDPGVGRNMIGRLVAIESGGRRYWMNNTILSEWAQTVKICVSHVDTQRVSTTGKVSHHVDKITYSVDISQPPSPASPGLAQWAH